MSLIPRGLAACSAFKSHTVSKTTSAYAIAAASVTMAKPARLPTTPLARSLGFALSVAQTRSNHSVLRTYGTISVKPKSGGRHAASAASASTDTNGVVTVVFPQGDSSAFHGIWLRDHCRCPKCFHAITKQRLVDTSEVPLDIRPSSMIVSDKSLTIHWSNPDHTSVYELSWLRQQAYAPPLAGRVEPEQSDHKFWGASLIDDLPTTPYKEIMSGEEGLASWLNNIDKYGIGFVSGVPANPHDTEKLARRISFIRESHYGGFWDFSPNLEHGDTAYTNIALPAHTDTTYFTDPIGLQFFHLLEHRGKGGESLYVDGFNVAEQLRTEFPWAYECLTTTPITAHSAGDTNTLMQPTPPYFTVLGLSPMTGRVAQIRHNNDDRSVLRHLTAHDVKQFYASLREWTRLLRQPSNELWVPLKPGLAVMMENWRVLHGRAAFSGFRRMVGSYHGWDDYRSRVKLVLRKGIDKLLI